MPQKTKNTPMMQQYLEMKAQYPDAFLFYRLGDFYELFNEDAIQVSQLLELTLTTRNKNADDPIPMCGVPHHAVQGYIDTLIEQGYKVAICEQMEDPKLAKGMVKREIVQLITPGTTMDLKNEAKSNNYLTTIIFDEGHYGFAYADLTTGEMKVSTLSSQDLVMNELLSLKTKEVVVNHEAPKELIEMIQKLGLLLSYQDEFIATEESQKITQELEDEVQIQAVEQLFSYLHMTQKRALSHLQRAEAYEADAFLKMDHYSKYNLELMQSIRTGKRKGTLLWLLDGTKTAMGGRLLKQWIDRPLIDLEAIRARQDKVQNLIDHFFERVALQEQLTNVYDLERLAGRIAFGSVNGRDLLQLKTSLNQVPLIQETLTQINDGAWGETVQFETLDELVDLIERSIDEEAPVSITDGRLIKDGYDSQLDQYRDAMKNGKRWLAEMEQTEREKTGIKNLKIGYNRVFGYYIEITKSNLANLPEDLYERKQTLANAERFITPELKKTETLILEAEEKSTLLEHRLFVEIREQVKAEITRIQQLAKAISGIDVLQSFATVSEDEHFVRPTMEANGRQIKIKNGRHPVVERVMGSQSYIPNDIEMDDNTWIQLITGPNMSGKSTYMRQLALTVVMAQIGCFVPAEATTLPVFDQIFTRIGAADDLISGQSTFMVEMMEANQALSYATVNSLILFDELGRGTATFDGMALAQAIIEYIHENVRAKTLFSTHYHELTALEGSLKHLKNTHVGAIEEHGELVFLHKMLPGPADKSYGVHVAKLAGLPTSLLARATVILNQLESESSVKISSKEAPVVEEEQLSLFNEANPNEEKIIRQLRATDMLSMTPMDAMNLLFELQKKL